MTPPILMVSKGVQSSSNIDARNRPVSMSEDGCTILLGENHLVQSTIEQKNINRHLHSALLCSILLFTEVSIWYGTRVH